MSRVDELHAELEMAELEESLATAKADPKTKPDTLRKMKVEVRAARQAYRELRDQTQED